MGKKSGRGTPDDLDYLFERDIIDEEDYVHFWERYWRRTEAGKRDLVNEYIERAAEIRADLQERSGIVLPAERQVVGVLYKNNRLAATRQAESLNDLGTGKLEWKVVRRNKLGQFSKRGSLYQAIPKPRKRR
jgi:hypothetical protein